MNCSTSKIFKILISSIFHCLIIATFAHAADDANQNVLDEIVIDAPQVELRDTFEDFMPLPTSKFKVKSSDIETINTISIEDTVRYAPNIEVRRRFFGDNNGVISIRGNGNFQTARHMLFVDGFPLHSLLRTRFNGAPQWNFVAPDETASVNITYGPFSPKHSGNAIGGVVDITTRQPYQEEWALQTTGWIQPWEHFESKGTAGGYKTFFSYGNKIDKFSYYMFYNRLETETQPTNLQEDTSTSLAVGGETAVTGAFQFTDNRVRNSIGYADDGEEEIIQDLVKFKANYDLSSMVKLRGMFGYLNRSREQLDVSNFIRDSNGNLVYSGTLSFGGRQFNVSESNFNVSTRDKQDVIIGIGAEGILGGGWNYDAALSTYYIVQDEARQSDENPNSPAFDRSGRLTEFSDSGWQYFDLKANKKNFVGNKNLSFEAGYHYSHAGLKLAQFNVTDWEESEKNDSTFRNSSGGQTDIHGMHANWNWELTSKLDFQIGGRVEFWRSFNGFKHETAGEIGGQDERDENAFSPKLSIGYRPNSELDFRFSMARATRFALPEELFASVDAFEDANVPNPGLKPEVGSHVTFVAGHYKPKATTQINLFYDDITNTIFSDVDDTVSTFINIDKVRTVGAELIVKRKDFLIRKHDFSFNLAYTDAEIVQNNGNPTSVGNSLPRVPKWRIKGQSVYHIRDNWDAMVAAQWQDRSFGRVNNDDVLDGSGAQSEYLFVDLKTNYKYGNLTSSFGITNLTNEVAFTGPHQYPNRTYVMDLAWKFM